MTRRLLAKFTILWVQVGALALGQGAIALAGGWIGLSIKGQP
jgi:hypothetical protein